MLQFVTKKGKLLKNSSKYADIPISGKLKGKEIMGMSAAQARLLYITAQLNNLSHRGQAVSDAKIRLSMDTEAIQERYTEALANSNLYVNSNIFTATGSVTKAELISLENLKAQNLLVYDGNKVLGYKYEEVDTGRTKTVVVGYEDDLTKPIYPTKTEKVGFEDASNLIPAYGTESLTEMEAIVAASGLGEDDLKTSSYTTVINGKETEINAIEIKSQAGFEAIIDAMGTNPEAVKQNYVFNLPEGESIDLGVYRDWPGIPSFQGIFDGNGTTFENLNGSQGLFSSLYGTVKNVNLANAVISADTDAIGGMAGYLADGASIENCNISNVDITCNLDPNKTYPEGYQPERAGVGGIVGLNNGNISGTSVSGTINVPNADDSFGYIGGAIGANINTAKGDSKISNTYADVNIVLSNNTDYSNSINGFIGDDTHETTISNCVSMGSITTADGSPINGTDLANWGPVIESDVTNMVALDTRNNNNVLYWANSTSPSFDSGNTNSDVLTEEYEEMADGSTVKIWLDSSDEGYAEQAENQTTAAANGIPVLNLSALQEATLAQEAEEEVPDTTQEPIGYEQKAITEEIPIMETRLVEDPDFEGLSSAELEMGLKSGKYQLVTPATENTTQSVSINGTDYELVSLSACTAISEQQNEQELAIAEAEYEKDMKEIQTKDKRYEMDQKKIDTEYDALLTEEESIKNVINKNVERSFKAFG